MAFTAFASVALHGAATRHCPKLLCTDQDRHTILLLRAVAASNQESRENLGLFLLELLVGYQTSGAFQLDQLADDVVFNVLGTIHVVATPPRVLGSAGGLPRSSIVLQNADYHVAITQEQSDKKYHRSVLPLS